MKLTDSVQYLKGVGPKKKDDLAKLGISSIYDLLTYLPRTYEDQSVLTRIADLRPGESATVAGNIMNVNERRGGRRGMSIITALIGDGTGFLQVTWFNQKYLLKQLHPGRRIFLTGKATYAYGGHGQMAMSQIAEFELLEDGEDYTAHCGIQPVYAATAKLNQKFFRRVISSALEQVAAGALEIPETVPAGVRARYGLSSRSQALRDIHFPDSAENLRQARRVLAFAELYLIQCGLLYLKKQTREQERGVRHLLSSQLVERVRSGLPFQLTHDQARTWQEIEHDMESGTPMRRLVQGDVGSGKTVIAMLALVKTVENGYQGALMAPTEILARQHYESFAAALTPLGVRVGFLSGRLTPKQREKIYAQLTAHEIDIVIGTHALIQEGVKFAALGLVVTDEQHRFGIGQRAALEHQGQSEAAVPDVLVMTATPIPRTMTLTVYGDLDISFIKELPPGRKPIRTFVRTPDRRPLIYKYVREQLEAGRQAYVVCPRIGGDDEAPDDGQEILPGMEDTSGAGRQSMKAASGPEAGEQLPSAEEVYEELSTGIFRGISCGLVHGRLRPAEKEQVMEDFYAGRIKLLVATTVIEVGVNVPNASMMVIEHAERFGLAQLHQLRGRIGRGEYQSMCILVSEGRTEQARERLGIMEHTSDGFELAEEDLRLRGPGQFFGSMQHGLGDLKVANVLEDTDILLQARDAARESLADPDTLRYVLPALTAAYREFQHINET